MPCRDSILRTEDDLRAASAWRFQALPKQYPTPESLRDAYEFDVRLEQMRRTQLFLTAAVVLLAGGLIGFALYAYPILKSRNAVLTEVPQLLTSLQKDVFTLGEQARATSAKLEDWGGRQDQLRAQLNKARGERTEVGDQPADLATAGVKSVPNRGSADKSGVKRVEFELTTHHGRQ